MKRRLGCLLAVMALALPAAALAQDGTAAQPTLVVQGQGVVSRAPDVASLSVSIETNASTANAAQAENNAAYARMVAALERAGVPGNRIQTSGYDLRYVPPPEPMPGPEAGAVQRQTLSVSRAPIRPPGERYGYVVTHGVSIMGLEPRRVGAIVDVCATAGATNIGGITFGVRDTRGTYNAALQSALQDADAQARALAAAGHFRIVRLQRVEAGAASVPGPLFAARMATAEGTQIAPSIVETRASVTVTYAIAPGG